jgi:hypothetical protein
MNIAYCSAPRREPTSCPSHLSTHRSKPRSPYVALRSPYQLEISRLHILDALPQTRHRTEELLTGNGEKRRVDVLATRIFNNQKSTISNQPSGVSVEVRATQIKPTLRTFQLASALAQPSGTVRTILTRVGVLGKPTDALASGTACLLFTHLINSDDPGPDLTFDSRSQSPASSISSRPNILSMANRCVPLLAPMVHGLPDR